MPKLPGVSHQKAIRALEKAGFRVLRQGKHVVMTDGTRIPTIPRANPVGRDLPVACGDATCAALLGRDALRARGADGCPRAEGRSTVEGLGDWGDPGIGGVE